MLGGQAMAENKKRKERTETSLVAVKWAVPVILCAIALFITFCFIAEDRTAHLGYIIAGTLRGMFSFGGYLIPALLVVHAMFFASDLKKKKLVLRIILSVLLLVCTSMLVHAIAFWTTPATDMSFNVVTLFTNGINKIGGGFIGGCLAIIFKFCNGGGSLCHILYFKKQKSLYGYIRSRTLFICKNRR